MLADDRSAIQIQLDVCADELDRMNNWEKEFIESISDQFTRIEYLSEKQLKILKRIYDKVA